MKVIWQVDDGYVGKSREQTTFILDEDMEGLSEEEKEEYIIEAVNDDFDNRIKLEILRTEDD